MKKMLITLAVALIAAGLRAQVAEDEVVTATGIAAGYRAAIDEALATALERHDGLTVSVDERRKAGQTAVSLSSQDNGKLDEQSRNLLQDAINKDMKKWARGKIKSYEVLSDTFENNRYRVEVAVHFPGKYEVGLPEGNRRRMTVAAFRSASGDSFRWYGQAESTASWGADLAAKLSERLTRTRKFTMLDRKFDAEVNAELDRLGSPNSSPADAIRLNQKLGTDYLVVGEVKFFTVVAPKANPLTGQRLEMGPQPFAEVMYRVLLAPTGQLKWSGNVKLDSSYPASSVGVFAAMTAEAASLQIAEQIMTNILPLEVVGKNGVGELVIGEGGDMVGVGDRFTVFALGDEVTDSRTGEVLDQIETAVGDVEIVRVSPKISYAKILGGDASKMVAGSRLRRVAAPSTSTATPSAPSANTTIRGNGTGGVVTPF